MPIGQFMTPQPNKLIAALQTLQTKQPYSMNVLRPHLLQHYLGKWLNAEALDANLSVVELPGGAVIRFIPKSTSDTFISGDIVKLEKSSATVLHITGKLVGDITLAGTQVNVAIPGQPTSFAHGTMTSTTAPLTWVNGADHFGTGVATDIYLNGGWRVRTAVGATGVTLTGLASGTNYSAYAKNVDGAGNSSNPSSTISMTTSGAPADTGGTTYTKTYSATLLRSYNYNGNLERNSWHDGNAYQGDDQHSGFRQFGLIQFPSSMVSDLSGKTPVDAKLSVTYAHWWAGSGGTAILGTHNYASIPSTSLNLGNLNYGRWSAHNNAGSRLTIDMGFAVCQEIQAGTTKGLVVGQGPSSSTSYYGYTYGLGTYVPKITVTYIA